MTNPDYSDELDEIVLKPAQWKLHDYTLTKAQLEVLIEKEKTKVRIEELREILPIMALTDRVGREHVNDRLKALEEQL